jgi:hypothetical protein
MPVVVLLLSIAGCSAQPPASANATPSPAAASARPTASPSPTSTSSATPGVTVLPAETASASEPGTEMTLEQLLALLATAPEDRTGYDRSLFRHWIDADGNGCNARREVLITEAVVPPTVGGGCSLIGGRWVSLYDGLVLTDASKLDIDHVVALGEAWDSGASAWSADRRMRFANDLDVPWALIAVSATSNRSKSDEDPADWLPPEPDDLCPFVSAWIAVKVRWALSVDQRERDALAGLVTECPDTRMPGLLAP